MEHLPTGTVTFMFTDIEGSTRLLRDLGDGYRTVQAEHSRLMREAIADGEGTEVGTEGDAFFAVFRSPRGAVRAAAAAQRSLAAHDWPHGQPLRVRIGMHTGEGILGGDDYVGIDVNRAARIADAGHGGQVLLSSSTRPLTERSLPDGVSLRDLGAHRLKDFDEPEHLHQLVIEGLPHEFPALRTLDARPTNLPSQRTSFVGREGAIAQVSELLEKTRLLTLTGPGGTGKTRLALEAAAGLLDRFADGVFFADLSPIAEPSLVPTAMAEALQVREEPQRPILDTLADHLRDRELLLLLDNFEQVTEAARAVEALLDAAPTLRVLATSRVPLHLYGERELPVQPLALPDPRHPLSAEALSQYESVALFIERATAVRPDFTVTNENAPAVAELTARLDGLPLAIELAASRVKLLTPQAMLARLGQRLPLLTGGARDLPERQQTLRGAIEWSHELLQEPERRLFARLSAFAGDWTLDAAEAVCGPGLEADLFEGLASLLDNSLLRRGSDSGDDDRFSMLETIREYAEERLRESGDEREVRRRHAELFRELAEEARSHITGGAQVAWLDRLDREHDNIRAALGWAIDAGDAETGLRTAAAVWRFWQQRGHLAEGREWLERLLSLPGTDGDTASRARALEALGSIAYWQNDYEPMRGAYEEAERIARELGDEQLLGVVLHARSYVAVLDRDFDGALALLREALDAAQGAGDRIQAAIVSVDIGFQSVFRGDPLAALQPLREGVSLLEEVGASMLLADNLIGLAVIERLAGELEAARGHAHRSLELFTRSGNELGIAMALQILAFLAVAEDRAERAARLVGAAARIRERTGGGAPPELIAEIADPEGEARRALGDEAFDRFYGEGRAMDTERAVAYATEDGK